VKEPIGVLHVVEPFRTGDALPVPDGFRAAAEGRCEVLAIATAVEREGCRLAHAVGPRACRAAVAAARLVRARVVCELAGPVSGVADALVYRAADAIVAPSAALLPDSDRVYVVHPSADPARFASVPRPAGPAVAVVAPLRPASGHLDVIEALALVRPRVPGLRATFAGEGPMRPLLEQRIRYYGLLDCIAMPGHVTDVPALFAGAAVACDVRHAALPTRALAEALIAGLPVVTCCSELGDPSLVVPPRSPALIAERLLPLLLDPARATALGAAARKRALELCSLEAARRRLTLAYAAALTVPGDRATSPRAPKSPEARQSQGH